MKFASKEFFIGGRDRTDVHPVILSLERCRCCLEHYKEVSEEHGKEEADRHVRETMGEAIRVLDYFRPIKQDYKYWDQVRDFRKLFPYFCASETELRTRAENAYLRGPVNAITNFKFRDL